jgi:hypothetical protein
MIRTCCAAGLVSVVFAAVAAKHDDIVLPHQQRPSGGGSGSGVSCQTAFDCSLNGVCQAGACVCDSPWVGAACETLQYAVTPAAAKNLWTGAGTDANLNTWNGPIVQGADGTFHLFDPVYEHESLWTVIYYAHGTASSIEGPYNWSNPNISSTAINPAALVVPNATATGGTVYSLWIGGDIWVADDAAGPYEATYKNPMPSNTAPAFFNGSIYVTDQGTQTIMTATSLAGPWSVYSTIAHPPGMQYTVEDPFLYIDARGSFHIINHAYNTGQRDRCTSSWVSSHFFSADGKTGTWGHTDQPYGHAVLFDDGTWHSYCTLERPGLNFDAATGRLTHIHFAADLVTGDEGCAARNKGCVDCKYDDHAGTLLVKLGA